METGIADSQARGTVRYAVKECVSENGATRLLRVDVSVYTRTITASGLAVCVCAQVFDIFTMSFYQIMVVHPSLGVTSHGVLL